MPDWHAWVTKKEYFHVWYQIVLIILLSVIWNTQTAQVSKSLAFVLWAIMRSSDEICLSAACLLGVLSCHDLYDWRPCLHVTNLRSPLLEIVHLYKVTMLFILCENKAFSWKNIKFMKNRSTIAVNCLVIIHCLEVSCQDKIKSAQCKLSDLSWYNCLFVLPTNESWNWGNLCVV